MTGRRAYPRVPRPLAAVALLVVALMAFSVGSLAGALGGLEPAPSQRASAASVAPASPTQALTTMLHALGSGDVRSACSVAAPDGFPIRTDSARAVCERQLRDQLDGLDDRQLRGYRNVVVTGAEIEGNSATIRPRHVDHAPVSMRKAVFVLVEVVGSWYVVV